MKAAIPSLMSAGVVFSALVATDPASARTITAKYVCDKGGSLIVAFRDNKAIVTPKGKGSIVLRQAIAADGFLYTKSKYSLRGRSNWVTWTVGYNKPLKCRTRG